VAAFGNWDWETRNCTGGHYRFLPRNLTTRADAVVSCAQYRSITLIYTFAAGDEILAFSALEQDSGSRSTGTSPPADMTVLYRGPWVLAGKGFLARPS
jgi:hypothetical protein